MSGKSPLLSPNLHQYGVITEPPSSVASRPFIWAAGVSGGQGAAAAAKKKKGKGKKKSRAVGSIGTKREHLQVYTPAQQVPGQSFTPPDNKPFRVVQTIGSGGWTQTSTSVPTFQAYSFTASMIDQIASFTALFDQYRVVEIEMWLAPTSSFLATQDGTPYLVVVDYDDANVLTTVPQAGDYQNCLYAQGGDSVYLRFKPHVAVAAYSGAFTSFANEESPWIDAASTGVVHYGMKVAFNQTANGVVQYTITLRVHLEWRNVR